MEKKGFLGIDVSKGYADFLLLGSNDQILEASFQLSDSKDGRQKLKELIAGWQQQGLEELYCGVESTGGYENNWYCYLKGSFKEKGVQVCRINPKGVKAISDASLKRTITDEVSAENIASYLIRFPHKLNYGLQGEASPDGFKDGRQHLTCINMQKKQKVQLNNQLEKLLYQHFAEILVYCRHGMPIWLLSMLTKYPSAAMVIKAGVANLSAIKGISGPKAQSLISKAGDNIQQVSPQLGHIIMVTAKEILHKELLIREEKEYLTDIYKDCEEVVLLSSIPGVGVDTAVIIALEIENVKRFETAKKVASFFGIHPTFKESGDGKWGNHMSKTGQPELRGALYMPSLTATRCNPVLKQVYARFRAKGMGHYQAIGVVMHKLLRIAYGILKNKTKFNAETDEQNQQRSTEKQHANEQKIKEDKRLKKQKKHRFQPLSTNAPISRRKEQKIKKQKIKEQIASQTSQ
jgi:transposase